MQCSSKIVVFDMDETLGYYMELGMFWDALHSYIREKNMSLPINQELFNKVLDLYPEFLRPNIISILNFLKTKKSVKHCHKLMIYTNNQGPLEWAQYIKRYFENKINYPLFDQVINAFKVNGKHIEICRTTHMKTHKDFIRCTKVPESSEICFIDDVYHPGMSNENIYYINIKPYTYDLSFDTMITRFINSGIMNMNMNKETETLTTFTAFISNFMKRYNYNFIEKSKEAFTIDKILSKKILQHLHIFFNKTNKTNKVNKANKTNKARQITYKIKKTESKTKKRKI